MWLVVAGVEIEERVHLKQISSVQKWFSRRRFGLFVHFGLYAINGWHEQEQWRRRVPRDQYSQLMHQFNPTKFDPDAFIDLAQSAGMEYICMTAKHHDGFCLWDTKLTDYNVMNSPVKRDLVGELAEACHRRDFPLGLYYSIPDWHHPNYPNAGLHHQLPKPLPVDVPDWDSYLSYLKEQVGELLSNYGRIHHFFWDVNVTGHEDRSINRMVRSLQPGIVINNRGFDEGDFGTPEREFREGETGETPMFDSPMEACNSVGIQSWGYRKDEDYYATSFLISSIDEMMAKGAHYLLNIGPMADGAIHPKHTSIIKEAGSWYKRVREAFEDTVPASDLTDNSRLLLTRRASKLYVHVKRPFVGSSIVIPSIEELPRSATLLNTGESLPFLTDMLPFFFSNRGRYLIVRDIPLERLENEVPVIRLEFDHLPPKRSVDYNFHHGGMI